MKFTVKKECFVEALAKMSAVSTNAVKTDYDQAFRVTISAEPKQIVFLGSNGHLSARYEITKEKDPQFNCEEEGIATVDVVATQKIANALGGETKDNIFLVSTDTGSSPALVIKDTSSKLKKVSKIQILSENHKFSLAKPKKGFAHTFKCDDFIASMNRVVKYITKHNYKVRYLMVCIQFVKDEIRFVAGDGGRFAIYGYKTQPNPAVPDTDEGMKFILPADQAKIITSLLADTNEAEFIFDEENCYVKPQNELTILLKGIPKEKYISYEKHAFRAGEAKAIVDVARSDLREVCALLNAARDKELEQQTFPSAWFESNQSKGQLTFTNFEGRYHTEFECVADIHVLTGLADYRSHYALEYLTDVSLISDKDWVRFYLIDADKTVIVWPVNLEDKKDANGVPSIKSEMNDSYMCFFFSAVDDSQEQG